MRGRAYRRHQLKRVKDKVRFIGRQIWKKWGPQRWLGLSKPPEEPGKEDPRFIGIDASTHCCPCSCSQCGNPRRSAWASRKDKLTRQEKQAVLQEREQLVELGEDDEEK